MATKATEAEKTPEAEKAPEIQPETVEEAPKTRQAKKGLTYAQTLEARSQRGKMTHQKQFAVKQVKKKEMEV